MFSDKWKINIKRVWLFLVSWLTAAQVEMQFLEWSYADVLPVCDTYVRRESNKVLSFHSFLIDQQLIFLRSL